MWPLNRPEGYFLAKLCFFVFFVVRVSGAVGHSGLSGYHRSNAQFAICEDRSDVQMTSRTIGVESWLEPGIDG